MASVRGRQTFLTKKKCFQTKEKSFRDLNKIGYFFFYNFTITAQAQCVYVLGFDELHFVIYEMHCQPLASTNLSIMCLVFTRSPKKFYGPNGKIYNFHLHNGFIFVVCECSYVAYTQL